MKKDNELYNRLKKTVHEAVFVEPADSYETIISAINWELAKNEDIGDMCEEMSKDMMDECDTMGMGSMSAPMPYVYPFLIATFPTFCLFEVSRKTYKAPYTYDSATRKATITSFSEVVLDVVTKPAPMDMGEEDD